MKYLKLFLFLLLFFISKSLNATTFIPMSYDEQIKKSDAIIHAVFKGMTYKKIGEGDIVTVNSFVLKGSSGISHSALINKNDFKVISPGGVWNGRTYLTTGSPKFKKKEEVVLFLNKSPNGYQVMNLSLGKYVVEDESGEKYIRNAVFPKHPRMKPIRLEELQKQLNYMGKDEIHLLDQRKSYVEKNKKQPVLKRKPASFKNVEDENNSFSLFALVSVLVGIGLLFRYVSKKFT